MAHYQLKTEELEGMLGTLKAGDTVTLGQTIGYVGCSAMMETALGDHLHFAVSLNDDSLDPQDFFALG